MFCLKTKQTYLDREFLSLTLFLKFNPSSVKTERLVAVCVLLCWQEFAVRRRMGMKELQQDQLEEVMTQGHLVGEKADWLLEEHRKVQAQMEKMYDEEVARQRILLEEKLEKRKALAKLEVGLVLHY